jgi:hypothetical protein
MCSQGGDNSVKWEDDGARFPAVKAYTENGLMYTVSGESYGGKKWWWYVEIGSDDAGQEDFPTIQQAIKAAEDFAPKLQAFLDSLKEKPGSSPGIDPAQDGPDDWASPLSSPFTL